MPPLTSQVTRTMDATKTTLLATALLAIATVSGLGVERAAAQDVLISGPLAGAPAVRNMRVYREGRVNLIPGVGYTLQDEYARSLFFTVEANYHFLDWIGVGVWGGFNMARIDTDLTTQISAVGQTTDRNRLSLPDRASFSNQVGRMVWAASLHLMFVPLRGKLSLFQSIFIDTDLYVFGGVSLFGLQERAATDVTASGCDTMVGGASTPSCIASASDRADRVAVTPMFGLGMSFYANSWFGVMIEWRAFPFSWNPSGTDESGEGRDRMPGGGFPDGVINGDDSRTTFNQMINIGLVFNLPPDQAVTD